MKKGTMGDYFRLIRLCRSFLQQLPEEEPDKLSNRVFQFDIGKDRWTECTNMGYSRYRCGTAVLNGEIYILGQTRTVCREVIPVFCL